MKTVKATEFPRIQLFMKSYTGMNNWETNFKNLSQMSTINQVTKQYPPTYLSVEMLIHFIVKMKNSIKHLNQKMYL